MVFNDFNINTIFTWKDQLWVVTAIITGIGAIEAANSCGEVRLFDYLDYKYCKKES